MTVPALMLDCGPGLNLLREMEPVVEPMNQALVLKVGEVAGCPVDQGRDLGDEGRQDHPSDEAQDDQQAEHHHEHGPTATQTPAHELRHQRLEAQREEERHEDEGDELRHLEQQVHEPVGRQETEPRHQAEVERRAPVQRLAQCVDQGFVDVPVALVVDELHGLRIGLGDLIGDRYPHRPRCGLGRLAGSRVRGLWACHVRVDGCARRCVLPGVSVEWRDVHGSILHRCCCTAAAGRALGVLDPRTSAVHPDWPGRCAGCCGPARARWLSMCAAYRSAPLDDARTTMRSVQARRTLDRHVALWSDAQPVKRRPRRRRSSA